jgi:HK97 family phage major capsid protein
LARTEEQTVASEWTTARRQDRISEIRAALSDMDREAAGDQFDQASRDAWNAMNSELDEHRAALDELRVREERLAEAVADPNPTRGESGFGGHTAVSTTFGDREGARNAALRAIERIDPPSDAADRLDYHVREQDPLGIDSRYLAAVSDPHYARAWALMVKDPMTGHLQFGKRETEAVQRVAEADQARAMAVGTGSAGQFAVPAEIDPSIMISGSGSLNPFRQISRIVTANSFEWRGVASPEVPAHFRAEATEVADDSPALVQPVIPMRRADSFIPFSIELDQDWATLQAELGKLLSDARDNLEADKFVNGVPGSNEPAGILNIGGTGSLTTAQRLLSAATGSPALADVWSLKAAVPPRFVENGSIVAAPATFDTAFRFVGGGSAEPSLFDGGRSGPVVGLRQASTSAMVTTTTSGSRVMLAGDFNAGHVVADRLGFHVELVPHLFGAANRYPTGQRGLLAIWRVGAAVVVPNALRYLEIK